MIAVRMGDKDPTNRCARGLENDIQMTRIMRPRIDDRHLAFAQQIGIGAWSGHHPCIARHNAANAWGQGDTFAGSELRSGLQTAAMICHR